MYTKKYKSPKRINSVLKLGGCHATNVWWMRFREEKERDWPGRCPNFTIILESPIWRPKSYWAAVNFKGEW